MTNTGDYALLTDVNQLHTLATNMLERGLKVGFDVETGYRGPDFKKRATDHFHPDQFTVGFSLTSDTKWARYVPLMHDGGGNVEDIAAAWEAVAELLTKGHIVAHNAKFEMHAVKKAANIDLCAEGILVDTMIDAYILNDVPHMVPEKRKVLNPDTGKMEDQPTGHMYPMRVMLGLKDLVKTLCHHEMTHIEELWPDMPANKNAFLRFNTLELTPLVVSYACEDAAWVLALSNLISARAKAERYNMWNIENSIYRVLRDMEIQGISLDWNGFKEAYSNGLTFTPQLQQVVKQGLGEIAGKDLTDLNLGSPAQMKKLFYKDMGLSTTRFTKTSNPDKEAWERMSTDAKAMKTLSEEYPQVKKLLEYREVQVLNRRMSKWLKEYSHSFDGKVHPNFKQAGTEDTSFDSDAPGTGRFSAAEPAIQQIQKDWGWALKQGLDPLDASMKEEWYKYKAQGTQGNEYWTGNYRDFIIASPGTYFLTYDYSQIELRMLAGESQEPALLEAFKNGTDIHTVTAAQMLGKRIEDVDKKTERPIGKTMNFALLYGMGAQSLSEQLGKTIEEATDLYQQYFSAFSRISSWMDMKRTEGIRQGYAETRFNRRYTVWELKSPNKAMVAKGKRVLINAPIQGAAADYMKMAMLRVYYKLKELNLWLNGCTIIMNQHDSLTFEVDNSIDPNWLKPIIEACVIIGEKDIPDLKGFPTFVADWELGHKWGSSTEWKAGMVAEKGEDGEWFINTGEVEKPEPIYTYVEIENEEPIDAEPPLTVPTIDTLTIILNDRPDETRFRDFVSLVKENPGDTYIQLICGDDKMDLPMQTSLGLGQQGKISLILGGAQVKLNIPGMVELTTGITV